MPPGGGRRREGRRDPAPAQRAALDGAANDALVRFLTGRLEVPRSAVELVAGHTGRSKLVDVIGITPGEAARRLGL